MTDFDSLRLKLSDGKSLTNEELSLAAKELNMPVEEIRLMVERALSVGMAFKSYKQQPSGLSKVATTLKSKKPAIYKVDHNLVGGMVQPPVNDSATGDEVPDVVEEIPDVVKEAARVLGMEAQQLFDMMRTKAVGIQGGIPNGSETRRKRQQRMSQPDLKSAVRGKLLSLLHPDMPISAVRKAIEDFTGDEKAEALEIMSSVHDLLNIPVITHKSTGSEWLDGLYDELAVRTFKQTAEKQFGKDVYAKLSEIRQVLSPQPFDQFTSKELNNGHSTKRAYTLDEMNSRVHPLIQAEMDKLNQTQLKTVEAKADAGKQTEKQQRDALYMSFTSGMLNPKLQETLKDVQQQAEVVQSRLHDAFTSKRLNPDKQGETLTTLKEAQHDTVTIEQSMAAREAALLRKWQATRPPEKPRGAPFLPGNL